MSHIWLCHGYVINIDMSYIDMSQRTYVTYGVATISGLLKIIGLFCRIQSLLQGSFAKETANLATPQQIQWSYMAMSHMTDNHGLVTYFWLCHIYGYITYDMCDICLLQKRPIILRSLLIVATPQHIQLSYMAMSHIWLYPI